MTDEATNPVPELYFGLVRAIGTDVDAAVKQLRSSLKDAGYQPVTIRISDEFRRIEGLNQTLVEEPLHERYHTYMNAGDFLRAASDLREAAALLAVRRIRDKRETEELLEGMRGRAFIIRHLMTKEEVATLRRIYGSAFFVVGVFSSEETRLRTLTKRIAESTGKDERLCEPLASQLIARDLGIVDPEDKRVRAVASRGRLNVRETFQQSDLFVSAAAPTESNAAIERFVEMVFGHPFHTPTRDEFGMAAAYLAARRSADLSRRVGATITSREGEVVAMGANDAPKAHGGQYWSDDDPDLRDWAIGFDWSDRIRRDVFVDIVRRLTDDSSWLQSAFEGPDDERAGIVQEVFRSIDLNQAVLDALESDHIEAAKLLDVTEYGRSVHAEMAAITEAARRGIGIQGAVLYSTTFPCHQCARHVVSAGLERVVYIEPYPKSRAGEIYEHEIGLADKREHVGETVKFEPFIGLGPERMSSLMSWVDRKQSDIDESAPALEGSKAEWSLETASPRSSVVDRQAVGSGAVSAATEIYETYLLKPFEELLEELAEEVVGKEEQ